MRTIATALLTLALAAPAGADLIFADGFETADDRYWTGPLEACVDIDQQPAPLCLGSMDVQPWMLACEAGERCWHICTDAPCLYLDVEG